MQNRVERRKCPNVLFILLPFRCSFSSFDFFLPFAVLTFTEKCVLKRLRRLNFPVYSLHYNLYFLRSFRPVLAARLSLHFETNNELILKRDGERAAR